MEINEKDLAKHFTSISAMDDLSDLTLKQARAVALLMEHERMKEKSPLNQFVKVDLSGISEKVRKEIDEALKLLLGVEKKECSHSTVAHSKCLVCRKLMPKF